MQQYINTIIRIIYGRCQNKVYVLYLQYNCTMTTVHLKTMSDFCLINRNYATHCNVITVLICYALQHDHSTNMLCMQLQCQYIVHWRIDLSSILLLLHISKPHLVQAGLSTRVANHAHAWTHACKNGGYHYVFYASLSSNSIPVSKYWHKYPILSVTQQCFNIGTHSVSNQFIGQKINPFFLAVKTSYRTHSCLNTTSRVRRLMRWRNIPAK